MVPSYLELIIIILACFRLTRLLVFDTITEFLRKPFHQLIEEEQPDGSVETFLQIKGTGLRKWLGELLSCYWCTGIWCSIFLCGGYFLYFSYFMPAMVILAVAGAAAIIESIVLKIVD
ncbi:DUF1360 domain-containing protein [Bacillus sp. FJAT-45350]|uniref:DUF1360 domain-containing protein n=1 Tax=Bacillus sp. FJAT-45350 TaxID=2011014 RepID=UPI000BB8B563|nr:DUF1360 domain-containing protein [Bacillus sp. FJAT-45350]